MNARAATAKTPTAAEVKADATKAKEQLESLEKEIRARIREIEFAAFKDGDRKLTADEKKKRADLEAAQDEVHKQLTILAFVTADRLDKSGDVQRLLERMQSVNDDLADDLARLKKIERFAEIAAKVADAIAKVVEKLAKIVASGAI